MKKFVAIMMALCLGTELPEDVFKQVLAIPDMFKAKVVSLE